MKSQSKSFTETRPTEEKRFSSDSRMGMGNGPKKSLSRINKIHQNPTFTLSTHISPILGFYIRKKENFCFYIKRKEKRSFVSLVIDEIKLKGNAVFRLGEATL